MGPSQGGQNGARKGRAVERAKEMGGRAHGWGLQPVILRLDPSIGAGRRRAGPGAGESGSSQRTQRGTQRTQRGAGQGPAKGFGVSTRVG